jgi:hypothetical protein
MGTCVYQHLLEVCDRVPYPLRDRFELWLLDADARPLALLDSALAASDIDAEAVAGLASGTGLPANLHLVRGRRTDQ